MNKEQLIALGLSDEQADKVVAGFGQMIPKSRLDEKIQEVKDLGDQIKDRDKQLEELKKVDAKGLQTKIDELQQANDTAKTEYETKLKETQLSSAVKLALAGKVHDADLVASLIDGKTIELDSAGNVSKGLDDQIKTLKESKSFLFVPEKDTPPTIKGAKPAEGDQGGTPPASAAANFAKSANEQSKSNENTIWG